MHKMLPYILLMLGNVLLASISQVLLKKAAQRTYTSFRQEYLNPLVIVAYGLFFITTLINVIAYRVIPLSMGLILEATSYLYITVFGVTFFGEKFSYKKLTALALIVTGILVYSILC